MKINKVTRFLALLLSIIMVLTVAGCGAKEEQSAESKGSTPASEEKSSEVSESSSVEETLEPVELTWIFGGPGKLEDSERVWEEFNKKLAEYLPNTTVKFTSIPTADYAEKWRLMSSAREEVDIVWFMWSLNLQDEVAKGAYLPLTDLIEEYGQDMKADLPEWIFDATTVDGEIYAIPCLQQMAKPVGISIPASHVEKGWLDLEEAEAVFRKETPLTKEDFKIFEEYFEKVKESGEDVHYISDQFMTAAVKRIGYPLGYYETVVANAKILRYGDDYKVFDYVTDYPESKDFYELAHEWYNKGYLRPDALENPTEVKTEVLLTQASNLRGAEKSESETFGHERKIFSLEDQAYISASTPPTDYAISSTSKNPERAMMLLNLMNSSKGAELMNLLTYGIEGEHYKKINDTQIEWLGEEAPGSANNSYGYNHWMLGNSLVTYVTSDQEADYNSYIDEVNKSAKMSRLSGFVLDREPIKVEIANYEAVYKEYVYLDYGTTPNYEELLAERDAKMKEAGSDKIIAEVQRQIDEWVAANNK